MKSRLLGDTRDTNVGRGLARFMNQGKLLHLGPNFATYRDRNAETKPDIVLANDKTFHNAEIEQGPLTTSDHIPIIITITAKATTETIEETPNMKQANWEDSSNK